MRINTNVAALNSYNQLKNTQNNLSKSLSRLSSGKRINGAADDAAGLAISEKMGSQTRGLAQAQRNAQDGISMIQTAEGALKESHSILQRMRELAVQSANDTNTEADRGEIQKEVNQLAEELTRIGETTEFNTQKLLDGTLDDTKFQIGANKGQNMEIAINDMRADSLEVAGTESAAYEATQTTVNTNGNLTDGTYKAVSVDNYSGTELTDANTGDGTAGNADNVTHVLVDDSGEAFATSEDGKTFTTYGTGTDDTFTLAEKVVDNSSLEISGTGTSVTAQLGIEDHDLNNGEHTIVDVSNNATYGTAGAGYNVGLQDSSGEIVALGYDSHTDNAAATNAADVNDWQDVNDTSNVVLSHSVNGSFATGSTIEVTGKGINVSTQEDADAAISTLDDAIASVSSERSKLGAIQNRLDHTINNLNTAEENLTAAESRISDVDMAKEMMNMSKQQILSQAGTAMMAQANQLPQGVLQLLG
jgi:flagellin